jgi:acetoacetate decarboxylase
MEPSLDDPWAELAVVKPLGAGYAVYSNPVLGVSPLAEFQGDEADNLFSYLFSGRWAAPPWSRAAFSATGSFNAS